MLLRCLRTVNAWIFSGKKYRCGVAFKIMISTHHQNIQRVFPLRLLCGGYFVVVIVRSLVDLYNTGLLLAYRTYAYKVRIHSTYS